MEIFTLYEGEIVHMILFKKILHLHQWNDKGVLKEK